MLRQPSLAVPIPLTAYRLPLTAYEKILRPHRHTQIDQEGPLLERPLRAPHVLEAEVDARPLLREADAGAGRDAEFLWLLARVEQERKGTVADAKAEGTPRRVAEIRGILHPERRLVIVLAPRPTLLQQVTVGTGPSVRQDLARQLELGTGPPAEAEPKAVRQVDGADPRGVAVHVHVSVGPGRRRQAEPRTEVSNNSHVQADTRIGQLGALGERLIVGAVGKGAVKPHPCGARDHMEPHADQPVVLDLV